MNKAIILYGTSWCPDCIRSKAWLNSHKVKYNEINIENNDKAVELVTQLNKGMQRVPTIVFPDGSILVEPTNKDLEEKIRDLI